MHFQWQRKSARLRCRRILQTWSGQLSMGEDGLRPTDLGEIVAHDTDESSGVASSQSRETDAGRLERLVHGLHKQALLGINGLGFALGNVEELMVKHFHVFGQQVSVQDIGRAMVVSIFVVEVLSVKAVDLSKYITWFSKKLPEF